MKEHINKIIEDSIKNNESIGSNCMVLKNNEVIYSGCFGYADKENKIPMSNNTIFRLFSLSKPITSAAVMILIDRKIISPNDYVAKYIPEFNNLNYVNDNNEVLPCTKKMKISHLLNMTSGIPYADNWGISVRASAKLFDEIIAGQKKNSALSTMEICKKAAEIPLLFQPGNKWYYGISADILGGVIEAATGQKYSKFLHENLFKPLEMNDTGFYVPADKINRFSALYSFKENGLTRDYDNYLGLTDFMSPPNFESGGAGIVSTISDYSKFVMMLMNHGTYNNNIIFSSNTFDYMTSPQLNSEQLSGLWDRLIGYNYGNLMRIMVNPDIAENKTAKGEFGWDGWTGTFFCTDSVNKLSCLYFTQICGAGTTKQAQQICKYIYK